MRQMMNIQELAGEVKRINEVKKDFLVSPEHMTAISNPRGISMQIQDQGFFDINSLAHSQISSKFGIPKRYYDRMMVEQPELLTNNINTWVRADNKKNLLRTLDGNVRAVLSDRYAIYMDNSLALTSAIPVLMDYPEMQYKSMALTEQKMYIQAVLPSLEREVKVGEPVQAGIVISNSEVGVGRFTVEKMIYILSCTNGQIRGQSIGKTHLSRRLDEDDVQFSGEDTIRAEMEFFKLMVRDHIRNAFDTLSFEEDIKKIAETTKRQIGSGKIEQTVTDISKKYSMLETEKDQILSRLIEGRDLTQWGMSQAVTNLANDTQDYDRVIELERIGGDIINMSEKIWYGIAS